MFSLFGVGETLRWIIGKAVWLAVRLDVEEMCQVDQLCVGMKAGIEGATHALTELFEEHKSSNWGALLIDATNAFNINIITSQRFLGGMISDSKGKHLLIKKKIEGWHEVLQTFAEIVDSQPQAAYAAFIHSIQHKSFFFRE